MGSGGFCSLHGSWNSSEIMSRCPGCFPATPEPKKARCKTCGGTPPNHLPSVLDKDGIGNPAHAIPTPTSLDELDGLPDWVCYADDGIAEATKAETHLTKYNRATGGCGEHPWSGGGSLPKAAIAQLLVEARIQELRWGATYAKNTEAHQKFIDRIGSLEAITKPKQEGSNDE